MRISHRPIALFLVFALLLTLLPVTGLALQVSPAPAKPSIAKGAVNAAAGDISLEETSTAEWGIADRTILVTLNDNTGAHTISFASLPIVVKAGSSGLNITDVQLVAANQAAIIIAGDDDATDKLVISNIRYTVDDNAASGDVRVTITSSSPCVLPEVVTSNAKVVDVLRVWGHTAYDLRIGFNDQLAGNIYIQETTATLLRTDDTISVTITTDGVVFSSAPTTSLYGGNIEFVNSSATLSADKRTAIWTVKSDSTIASYIALNDIRYDVLPAGKQGPISVTVVTSSQTTPTTQSTITNAYVSSLAISSYAFPIIESPVSGNWYAPDSTVTVNGIAKPGSVVEVYNNSGLVASVIANTLGNWRAEFKYTGWTQISARSVGSYDYGDFTRARIAMFMCDYLSLSLINPSTPTFSDVPVSHWAYRYIATAMAHGIMNGYPDGTFRPDEGVTRAEFIKMLVGALKLPSDTTGPSFNDVPYSHWAYSYIMTARNNGLVLGNPDNSFRPAEFLARRSDLGNTVRFYGISTRPDSKSVHLSWRAHLTHGVSNPMQDIAGYNIYRSESSGTTGIKVNETTITGSSYSVASYDDSGLENNKTYYYQIAAINGHGYELGKSQELSIAPVAATIIGTTRVVDDLLPPEQITAQAIPVDVGGNLDNSRTAVSGNPNASGEFTLTELEPGYYKLKLSPPAGTPYLPEYYNNVHSWATAKHFYVGGAQVFELGRTCLEKGAAITGQVVAEDGTPLKDVFVDIYDKSSGDWFARTYTNWRGFFELILAGGNYKVNFEPPRGRASSDATFYDPSRGRATQDSTFNPQRPRTTADAMIGEWYDDVSSYASAKLISVTNGSIKEGIDATLTAGGSIFGRVADQRNAPIQGVRIDVYDTSGRWVDLTFSNPIGAYAVKGLKAGLYKLHFNAANSLGMGFGFESEWYNDQPTYSKATTVNVVAGDETPGIEARLSNRILLDIDDNVAPTITLMFSENIQPGFAYSGITLSDANGKKTDLAKSIDSNIFTMAAQQGLTPGMTYTVFIPAGAIVDNAGNSLANNHTFSFTTQAAPPAPAPSTGGGGGGAPARDEAPAAPERLKVTSTQKMIQLVWNGNKESDLAGYNVYRKEKASGKSPSKLNTALIKAAQYQDRSVLLGKSYVYYVTAVSKAGHESKPSAEVEASLARYRADFIFSDVPSNAWFKEFVSNLISLEIIGGYPDGTFKPTKPVNRAEFAKMVCLAMGWELQDPATPSFNDVAKTHWAYKYVETAKANGVLGGYGDGTIRPGNNITRAEVAKIVAECLELTPNTKTFNDTQVHWARQYIDSCAKATIINGYTDNTFRPNKTTTRAEAAKVVTGILDKK